MNSTEGQSGFLQLGRIAQRLQYPVENLDHLVRQTAKEEIDIFGEKLRIENILKNETLKSLASTDNFPITNEKDLTRKFVKAYNKFVKPEVLAFNGTPIRIKRGERIDAKKLIALKILSKYKLVQSKVEN